MIYGLGTHIASTNKTRCVNIAKYVGVTSLREDISWNSAEATIGNFALTVHHQAKIDAMAEIGADNIMILSYGNTAHGVGQPYTQAERDKFCTYVRWLVPLVSSVCKYIEIWNEWNHGAGASAAQVASGQHSGTQQYADLCRDVYPIIKELHPQSIVLAGSTSKLWGTPWLGALYDMGLLNFCDGISLHPYTHSEAYPNYLPPKSLKYMSDAQAVVRTKNNGADFPFYVTEIGWPTHTAGHVASNVAGYLGRVFKLYEAQPWIKGAWWYDIFDGGTDATNQENRFGLVANDAITPKPAAHAYRALTNRTRNDQVGWCRIAVTAAVEARINAGTLPERAKLALKDLRSTNTPVTIGSRSMRVMTGPFNLAVFDDISDQFADDFHIIEGPVVRGQIPAQTTVTRDPTYPNGWY